MSWSRTIRKAKRRMKLAAEGRVEAVKAGKVFQSAYSYLPKRGRRYGTRYGYFVTVEEKGGDHVTTVVDIPYKMNGKLLRGNVDSNAPIQDSLYYLENTSADVGQNRNFSVYRSHVFDTPSPGESGYIDDSLGQKEPQNHYFGAPPPDIEYVASHLGSNTPGSSGKGATCQSFTSIVCDQELPLVDGQSLQGNYPIDDASGYSFWLKTEFVFKSGKTVVFYLSEEYLQGVAPEYRLICPNVNFRLFLTRSRCFSDGATFVVQTALAQPTVDYSGDAVEEGYAVNETGHPALLMMAFSLQDDGETYSLDDHYLWELKNEALRPLRSEDYPPSPRPDINDKVETGVQPSGFRCVEGFIDGGVVKATVSTNIGRSVVYYYERDISGQFEDPEWIDVFETDFYYENSLVNITWSPGGEFVRSLIESTLAAPDDTDRVGVPSAGGDETRNLTLSGKQAFVNVHSEYTFGDYVQAYEFIKLHPVCPDTVIVGATTIEVSQVYSTLGSYWGEATQPTWRDNRFVLRALGRSGTLFARWDENGVGVSSWGEGTSAVSTVQLVAPQFTGFDFRESFMQVVSAREVAFLGVTTSNNVSAPAGTSLLAIFDFEEPTNPVKLALVPEATGYVYADRVPYISFGCYQVGVYDDTYDEEGYLVDPGLAFSVGSTTYMSNDSGANWYEVGHNGLFTPMLIPSSLWYSHPNNTVGAVSNYDPFAEQA